MKSRSSDLDFLFVVVFIIMLLIPVFFAYVHNNGTFLPATAMFF
jgi:hypothetical protein